MVKTAEPAAAAKGTVRRMADVLLAAAATTTFRLASVLVAVVVLAGAVIMGTLYGLTNEMLSRQLVETMTVEADGFVTLARTASRTAVADAVSERARTRLGGIYLLIDANGTKLAGNLDRWPPEVAVGAPGGTFRYRGANDSVGDGERLGAGMAATLPSDMRLLVARDVEAQQRLADRIKWLFLGGFGLLALAGIVAGIAASRLVLRRVGDITRTAETIMAGDFTGRVPLSGAGDELDHLAANLNTMLDRIEQLMAGLREVSDNIAHDLKTPLNRLRHRAEAALRDPLDLAAHREGLERVIEEADELIKTFNALLLIARLEAGTLEESLETFDLGAVVRDVAELYAPVAEEAGLLLSCEVADGLPIRANRQLIGQAVANLIDNAIKYGRPAAMPAVAGGADIEVKVAECGDGIAITVADHGPGIPAADRERVLKRFVRLETSRTRPGTGLGLSLVAAVARLEGGRLSLEDNAPGLKAILLLPRRARAEDNV